MAKEAYILEEQREMCSGGGKIRMLAATTVKMSGSDKKINKNTYDVSSIKRVTRKFLEVSRCSRAKNVCCTCKVASLLIRPIVALSPFSFPSSLSIKQFYCSFKIFPQF